MGRSVSRGMRSGTSKSSVTDHIIDEGHACTIQDCFRIIYKAKHKSLLKYAEAVAIRLLKPELNVQQDFNYHLKLPWS